jgi:putative DNA primase/helicase
MSTLPSDDFLRKPIPFVKANGKGRFFDMPNPVDVRDVVRRKLTPVDLGDFLSRDIPPREMLLAPVLPSQGLLMLYASRGIGKTYMAMNMAYAIAAGQPFLRWQVPAPRRVLYVDGEMPGVDMQMRFAELVKSSEVEPPTPDYFRLVTPDLHPDGIPDLSTAEGQEALSEHLADISVLVLDNLSTLCRSGRENESESWESMQQWLLTLRRRGLSVILVHHAGKGGQQRGTSKREDILDTVVCLRRPEDYNAEEGARFEIHLEKARGIAGTDAKPFEARMETRDGAAQWTTRDIEDVELQRVRELTEEEYSVREIADEMGISKSKVNRIQKRIGSESINTGFQD